MHVFETEPKTRGKRDTSKVCTCVCVCVCGGGGGGGGCHVKTETLIDIVNRREMGREYCMSILASSSLYFLIY